MWPWTALDIKSHHFLHSTVISTNTSNRKLIGPTSVLQTEGWHRDVTFSFTRRCQKHWRSTLSSPKLFISARWSFPPKKATGFRSVCIFRKIMQKCRSTLLEFWNIPDHSGRVKFRPERQEKTLVHWFCWAGWNKKLQYVCDAAKDMSSNKTPHRPPSLDSAFTLQLPSLAIWHRRATLRSI